MVKNKLLPLKGKKKFVIVVDGECESWYFQMLKRNKRALQIDLKPEIPQKKELSAQYGRVLDLAKDYDKVIWIVDLDVVNNETRKAKTGKKTKMSTFRKYAESLKSNKRVEVIVNNPCLEFWFLLHFEETAKFFDDCRGATKALKKHLPDYEKTQNYFTKEGNDIFKKLEPRLETAIANAEKLGVFDIDKTQTGFSGMHAFFDLKELKITRNKKKSKPKPK